MIKLKKMTKKRDFELTRWENLYSKYNKKQSVLENIVLYYYVKLNKQIHFIHDSFFSFFNCIGNGDDGRHKRILYRFSIELFRNNFISYLNLLKQKGHWSLNSFLVFQTISFKFLRFFFSFSFALVFRIISV